QGTDRGARWAVKHVDAVVSAKLAKRGQARIGPREPVWNSEPDARAAVTLPRDRVRVFDVVTPDLVRVAVELFHAPRGPADAARNRPRSAPHAAEDRAKAPPAEPCRDQDAGD